MTTSYTTTGHAHPPDEVGLSVLRRPAHTIARLHGELDVATAPALRERLAAILRPRIRLLVLDMSEIWFCDAAGLAVLIGTQRRATLLGTTLRLAAPRAQVARVLHATGLNRSLAIYPTPADALAQPLTRHEGRVGQDVRGCAVPAAGTPLSEENPPLDETPAVRTPRAFSRSQTPTTTVMCNLPGAQEIPTSSPVAGNA